MLRTALNLRSAVAVLRGITMYRFRWAMLVLYLVLPLWIFFLFLSQLWPLNLTVAGVVAFSVLLQGLFIFGAGTRDLVRYRPKIEFLAPSAVTVMLYLALACGALMTLLDSLSDWWALPVGVVLVLAQAAWFVWGLRFWCSSYRLPVFCTLRRFVVFAAIGALLELTAAVASYLILTCQHRGGPTSSPYPSIDLTGIRALFGVLVGLSTSAWCVGPALMLLFLRPRLELERKLGHEAAPPPRGFRYSLAGLLIFSFFLAALMPLVIAHLQQTPAIPLEQSSLCSSPFYWLAISFALLWIYRILRRVHRWETETLWELAKAGGKVVGNGTTTGNS